jgi:hypothetical protein
MYREVAVCVIAIQALAACKAIGQRSQNEVGAARQVVERFLQADTSGRSDAALSLLNQRKCDVLPTTDFLAPSVAVMIKGAVKRGDTVFVTAVYRVLGKAWSEDASTSGPNNWRFTGAEESDTLIFPVTLDSKGESAIECGYFPANHPGLTAMARFVDEMDDSSRVAWQAAKQRSKVDR